MIALSGKQITYSAQIMNLWRRGMDTHGIAEKLCLPEHVVANALARARDRERGQ